MVEESEGPFLEYYIQVAIVILRTINIDLHTIIDRYFQSFVLLSPQALHGG
jgi:hypothetical protein